MYVLCFREIREWPWPYTTGGGTFMSWSDTILPIRLLQYNIQRK